MVTRQGDIRQAEHIADARGYDRAIADEEGAVCAEACGDTLQRVVREGERRIVAQQLQHKSGVGRATAQSGAEGDRLLEMDGRGRNVRLLAYGREGTHDEIVVRWPINRKAVGVKRKSLGRHDL